LGLQNLTGFVGEFKVAVDREVFGPEVAHPAPIRSVLIDRAEVRGVVQKRASDCPATSSAGFAVEVKLPRRFFHRFLVFFLGLKGPVWEDICL